MSWRSLEELSTEFDLDTSTDREAMRLLDQGLNQSETARRLKVARQQLT